MKAPLRPKTWNFFCRSSDNLPSCVASRPIHSGARMESMATFTAGMAVKPNVSPQPTTPVSVVTETISESAVCKPALPHTPASDGPPVVKGIRNGMVSILAIFMQFSSLWLTQSDGWGSSRLMGDFACADRPSRPCIRGLADQWPLPE